MAHPNIEAFFRLKKQIGFASTIRYAIRRIRDNLRGRTIAKNDIAGFYSFTRFEPFGEPSSWVEGKDKTLNWVIPDFNIGSGGHLNIFRMIYNLEKKGFVSRIVIDGHSHFKDGPAARKIIRENFFPINSQVSIGKDTLQPAWSTFATSWPTAYTVRNFRGSQKKFYFVQDFEPYFYAQGSEFVLAEQTYKLGFTGITAGGWLAEKLSSTYNMKTLPLEFSYDRALYGPKPRREPERRRVLFYARPVTLRRGFELGLMALNEVSKRCPDVEFVLAGWDTSGYKIDFPHLNAGVVALAELPDLYSQCDVALVLSFTNLSLLPLEIMACGCPVVSNKGPNVEWLLNKDNCMLADSTVEALSNSLVEVLADKEKRLKLVEMGLSFVQTTSWEREASKFVAYLEEILDES